MYNIFTKGSCFRLYKILKIIEPKSEAYWSDREGHCITKIEDKFYDIGGEVNPNYIEDMGYFKISDRHLEAFYLLKYTTNSDEQPSVITEKYRNN